MKKIFQHPNHPKPVTRRQFLASGMIELSTYALLPSAISMILNPKSALAAECASVTGRPDLLPFLVFDCAGGAALSGNFLVGKQGGSLDFLSSYNKMGIAANPKDGVQLLDSQFGVPMLTGISQIHAGITASTTATGLRMATICTASTDDTGQNMLNPVGLVSRTGMIGTRIQTPVGTQNSLSGGNSKAPLIDPSMKPFVVTDAASMVGALSYGAGLTALTSAQRAAIGKSVLRLSLAQKAKLSTLNIGDQFANLAECGLTKNLEYADTAAVAVEVDPRQDANCQAVYGITPTSTGGATRIATVVYNVLKGNTGPGVITIGGCDYHDGTQTTGDTKDLEIGTAIGRAVELANRMGKAFFFAIITDGSVYSDNDTRIWRGDASSMSIAVIGYFNPSNPPAMRTTQLGYYREGQGVERSTVIGNDPKRAAYVMFLNYLAASGRTGEFSQYVPRNEFDPAYIDAHLVFG